MLFLLAKRQLNRYLTLNHLNPMHTATIAISSLVQHWNVFAAHELFHLGNR